VASAVIYILHGDDDFAINEFLDGLQANLGDPSMAEMNTTLLDGRATPIAQVQNAAAAIPFLTSHRLIIVSNALALVKGNAPKARQSLLEMLEKIPDSTQLVLLESRPLMDERDRRRGKVHWLETWAQSAGERVEIHFFGLPHGPAMAQWISAHAKKLGGQFTPQAASHLAELIGDDPRMGDQEIEKLLAYVNYSRSVEIDDVEHLTPSSRQGDIFAMVDALGNRQGKRAQEMLHLLLQEQDTFSLFGMVIRQFRLLLLAREVIESGGREADAAQVLGVHPFVAGKVYQQARLFTLPMLETIYNRLLELDVEIKTSQLDGDLALDMLVAGMAR